jgi:2-alkyl-3-oxoalkanoate reductase
MHIAVTGATGLVGSHLVNHFSKKGHSIAALVRNKEKAENLSSQNVQIVEANISNKEELRNALKDVDVVFHAAGLVDPYGSRELIFKTNVEGTRNVLTVAKELGVKQFVFISSLSVITGFQDQFDVDERAPLQKSGEAYADSKVAAESLVFSETKKSEIAVTVLRPGFIYGPGERSWLPRLIDSIARGKAMLIDGGKRETNVIYIENLNLAAEAALLNRRAYGQIYNLTDGQHVSKKQLFDAISDGLKLPRVTKVVPYAIAKSFCQLISSFAPLLPIDLQKNLARYSKAAFRLAGLNQGFSVAKAERDLNYTNRISFDEGMRKTLSTIYPQPGVPQLSVKAAAGRIK